MDDELVRALLQEQHPDLAELPLTEVAGGWDNKMWRLGDELAVRLPRTDRGPALLRKEHRWLPELAGRLPLPVPVPARLGVPSERFPHSWLVTTWVAGEPADRTPVSSEQAADSLATFLRALHQEAPGDAPISADRGRPLRTMDEGVQASAAELGVDDVVRKIWADGLAAPDWDGPALWLHGDLHPANMVVIDGTLAGVIDFGDMCAGDPATDLSAAWMLLPDGANERFFESYPVDEATWRRARGWAVARALGLIAIGNAGDNGLPGGKPTWGPAGRRTLERLL
jgi:aminoglycoside phosphotransferase (APT) family kinase protein